MTRIIIIIIRRTQDTTKNARNKTDAQKKNETTIKNYDTKKTKYDDSNVGRIPRHCVARPTAEDDSHTQLRAHIRCTPSTDSAQLNQL